MSKQKQEKITTNVTPQKISHDRPLIQIERELTEAQLEAIAGGIMIINKSQ